MKVVLINTYSRTGGAAIACTRLGHALQKAGIDVTILTSINETPDDSLIHGFCENRWKFFRYKWAFVWERLTIFLQNRLSRKNLFLVSTATSGVKLARHPLLQDADIIHLHWINQGFVSIKGLKQILALGKPVVWTLHDMWSATGICHYAGPCTNYQTVCGKCPLLGTDHSNDLSRRIYKLKKRTYGSAPINFVTCSSWLRSLVEKSSLIKTSNTVCNIPNPIDTDFFIPVPDKTEARRELGLPLHKKLILFGAVNAADTRKGFSYLIDTLNILHSQYSHLSTEIELVVFGKSDSLELDKLPYKSIPLGYITQPEELRKMYQAADIYVTPSLEDNLPNTIMEAMSCGTPCIGFNVGGIPEMINSTCGYVARYKDTADMAFGINYVLDAQRYSAMSQTARAKVEIEYSEKTVSSQYIRLYKQLLHAKP